MNIKIEDYIPIYSILVADDQIVLEDQQDMTYKQNNPTEGFRKCVLGVDSDKAKYIKKGGAGQNIETQ